MIFKKIGLVLFGLVIAWLGLEVLMIAADPILFRNTPFVYDPALGFRARPNFGSANRSGFNDIDRPFKKPDGVYRVMVLGDSFNWLGGRTMNYTALMQKRFDRQFGPGRIEVLNIGFPCTGPSDQLALLKKEGLRYEPDLLLLGFFTGNDFLDTKPEIKRVAVNGMLAEIDPRREWRLGNWAVVLKPRAWPWLKHRYRLAVNRFMAVTEAGPRPEKIGTFSEEEYLRMELARMQISHKQAVHKAEMKNKIDSTLSSISEMSRLLKERKIPFHVAMYPDEFMVDTKLAMAIAARFGARLRDYDPDQPQRILSEHLKGVGVPHTDLTPAFREKARKATLYLFRDSHWNDNGNDLAAELLYDHLLKNLPMEILAGKT